MAVVMKKLVTQWRSIAAPRRSRSITSGLSRITSDAPFVSAVYMS